MLTLQIIIGSVRQGRGGASVAEWFVDIARKDPRFSLEVVDLAALHLIAMTAPQAAGQRYIAAGEVMWMADVARTLRDGLGKNAAKVPTRAMPDWLVRLGAHFIAPMRQLRPMLGRRHSFSSEKARAAFGFVPRPARDTILDCGASLI